MVKADVGWRAAGGSSRHTVDSRMTEIITMLERYSRCLGVLTVCLLLGLSGCGPPDDNPDVGDAGTDGGGMADAGDTGGDDGGGGAPDCEAGKTFEEAYGTEITSNTTISAGACLTVESNIAVTGNETALTIEEGATLKFAEGVGMEVYDKAALVVEGTADDKVTFTGTTEEKGWWGGLAIWDSTRSANQITHAVIEYAGDEDWSTPKNAKPSNLQLKKGGHGSNGPLEIAITDTEIRQSATRGMHVVESVDLTDFENNTLADNSGPDASVHPDNVGTLGATSTWNSPVVIRGGTLTEMKTTWPSLGVPYRIEGNLEVQGEETKLTFAPGGTYKFAEGTGMEVFFNAVLVVDGSSDNKVMFTGTTEEKGWWGGIAIWDTDRSANAISHAVIEYAGDPNWSKPKDSKPSNLQLKKGGHGSNGPVEIAIDNTTIRNSATLGMRAKSTVDLGTFENNTFEGNEEASASMHPENVGDLATSTSWGSRVLIRGGELTGEKDTWPALEVPYQIEGNIAVTGEETKLTFAPGGTYQFTENTGMEFYFNAVLVVDGKSGDKVTFTGTTQEKGWWGGIAMWHSARSANRITHAVIQYGGDPNWSKPKDRKPSLLELKKGGHGSNGPLEIALDNVALESSETAGLFVHESTSLTTCNVTFSDNNTDITASDAETKAAATSTCGL